MNIAANDGATPLHEAASRDYVSPAKLLLEHGAQANIGDNKGATVLHNAASWGLLEHDKAPSGAWGAG